ncbi:MAG: carboxymuconolactone decarboxylase family protein [bacterium]
MRLSKPRIKPLEQGEGNPEQQEILQQFAGDGEPKNIFKTLARYPKLLKRWLVFANHILGKSSLPPRERELIILRIGWLCRSGYEWNQHVEIAGNCGLSKADTERIKEGADNDQWSSLDKLLLRATDELFNDSFVSDETWSELAKNYTEEQLMDIVFTIGNYNLVSMALNTLGVQMEPTMEDSFH